MAGFSLEKTITLKDGFDLVPWAEVPESVQKKRFGVKANIRSIIEGPFSRFPIEPTAALRTREAPPRILFESQASAPAISVNGLNLLEEQAMDVERCITCLAVRPIAILGSWEQLDNEIASAIVGEAYSYGNALFDTVLRTGASYRVEGESIADLFRLFDNFDASQKAPIRIALDRLNQALREPVLADKAIDLGIALEVMLLHEIGEQDRGELKFRTSIRGSAFLEGSKARRLETFKLFKKLYDLRSKAVHSGALKSTGEADTAKTLKKGSELCAHVARKLIERGSFPNWDAEYVIGGE